MLYRPFVLSILCPLMLCSAAWAKWRVDYEARELFGNKIIQSVTGHCAYDTKEAADNEAARLDALHSMYINFRVERCNGPDVEVAIPGELNPSFPSLDEESDAEASESGIGDTLKEYADKVGEVFENAKSAREWSIDSVERLSDDTFTKVNTLIERSNNAVSSLQQRSSSGQFQQYSRIAPLTQRDITLSQQKDLLEWAQQTQNEKRGQLAKKQAGLQERKSQLEETRQKLEAERDRIQEREFNFDQRLQELMKEFAEIDKRLSQDPSDEEAQQIQERMQDLKERREALAEERDAAKDKAVAEKSEWKNAHQALLNSITQYNQEIEQFRSQAEEVESTWESKGDEFRDARQAVRLYFDESKAYGASDGEINQDLESWLGSD